ncbi:MAG: hypothetical protein Q8868_09890 [Bacteroidota bacterium]|nr:hypothetical protein [Bacteroidota bacterium]
MDWMKMKSIAGVTCFVRDPEKRPHSMKYPVFSSEIWIRNTYLYL